jgi:hypothetical protein
MKSTALAVVLWAAVQGVFVWDKLCWHTDASWLYATLPTWLALVVGCVVAACLYFLDRAIDAEMDLSEMEDGR